MDRTERFYKINELLRAKKVVSFATLLAALGVSRSTLKRDLNYLCERLHNPIAYNREMGGYQLAAPDPADQHPHELPGLWFSPTEIHALLTMQQLVAGLDAGGVLTTHIAPLMERLNALLGPEGNPEATELRQRVRIIRLAQRSVRPRHFEQVATALAQRKRLHMAYTARGNGHTTERDISPQRLVHYRDNWYLDAWCHQRQGLRNFALDAITKLESLNQPAYEVSAAQLSSTFSPGYGIFSGGTVRWARLRFSPERARWVAQEQWHPEQSGKFESDGSYLLRLPYTDHRELIMDILKHGAHCEVLGPPSLRRVVAGGGGGGEEAAWETFLRGGREGHLVNLWERKLHTNQQHSQGNFIVSDALAHSGGHLLAIHLEKVAELAAEFSKVFDTADPALRWAYLAGLWHDLGKYRPGFQRYVRLADNPDAHIEGKVGGREKTHSAAGAMWAMQQLNQSNRPYGNILAYLIAGHHAGLDDWDGGLKERLQSDDSKQELKEALANNPPAHILAHGDLVAQIPGGANGFALWVRMLFSCLVDADFLDTEAHFDAGKPARREGFPTLEQMRLAFDAHMAALPVADTPVNTLRADILRQCRAKAALPAGFFSLTVPTGGGKTLSSLAFALEHAQAHGKRRVIYAIPYTSIIEQTADVFRNVFKALGDEVLIEHHSQADAASTDETMRSRLACENWDAPLVVTTNVQLFESLFASKTSRCRKLHNMVGSVIVLDEAQQLPPAFLQPILDVLNLLVAHYGVTVVLCTATQPALSSTTYFDTDRNLRGLQNVREIIDNPDALFDALKRVDVVLPPDWTTPTAWADIAKQLSAEDCVLAIVNTRKAARELQRLIPADTLHLSALMCGAHRKDVIAHIKERLKAKREGRDQRPLRVVSTQLVEAGVDIDFPVVYRALAGLDSIAQAAGRCNREGRMDGKGRVVVFVPPVRPPLGHLRKGADACISTLHGQAHDPLARALFDRYFKEFYHSVDLDAKEVVKKLTINDRKTLSVQFRTAAEAFRLIDDQDSATVVVRYAVQSDEIDKLLGILAAEGPQRWLMRKLQRYTVSIHKRVADKMRAQGSLTLPMPGLYVQVNAENLYDPMLGLKPDDDVYNPGGFAI